jgi:hypothetical protein
MKEKILELLWDLENYKYPDYNKKADEILLLFNVIKNEVTVCFYIWHKTEIFTDGCCSKCHQYR